MARTDMKPPPRVRIGVALVVLLLHAAVIGALIRAFAPDLGAAITGPLTQAFDIALPPPPRPPPPPPAPTAPAREAPTEPEGAAAPAGRKATPREVVAPRAEVVLSPVRAPAVAASGETNSAGARDSGEGTGAGGAGQGLGAGGTGGGGVAKAVKIAGEINSARDYPRKTRALRLGGSVVIALTVGVEGRVTNCRILRPSRDSEADRITCKLAIERFRFRPAVNAAGDPVESVYGWQQRWFTPAQD